jgi:hypothetical protein
VPGSREYGSWTGSAKSLEVKNSNSPSIPRKRIEEEERLGFFMVE